MLNYVNPYNRLVFIAMVWLVIIKIKYQPMVKINRFLSEITYLENSTVVSYVEE